jgi:hypothetical protein
VWRATASRVQYIRTSRSQKKRSLYNSVGAPACFSSPSSPLHGAAMVVLVAALALLPIALIVSAEQGHHYGNPGHTRSNIPRTLLNPRVDVHGLFLNTDGVNGTAPFTSLEKRQCAGPTCSGTCCVADATCRPTFPLIANSLGIHSRRNFSSGCASTIICCKPTYFCFAQVCCLKTTQIGCGTGCIPTGGDCCNSNGDWCDPGYVLSAYDPAMSTR